MNKNEQVKAPQAFELTSAHYFSDSADMTVVLNGEPTTWVWTFAGPGHANTIAWTEKVSRERLTEDRQKEAAITNGKKWKPEVETTDQARDRNISWIVSRLLSWSPVIISGQTVEFSEESARKILLDPNLPILTQAVEFLTADKSFTNSSGSN